MLSDSDAHFTPEFEGNLAWSEQTNPEMGLSLHLSYFDTTMRTINSAFLNLAAIHLRLLDVFNACFQDGLDQDGGWRMVRNTVFAIARELGREFKPEDPEAAHVTGQ